MKYSVILFDADDTLFDFGKSECVAFENTMREFGFDYDKTYHLPLYQEINSAIWKAFESGLITQKLLKVERFRRLGKVLRADFDPEVFADSYIKQLSSASFPYDESLPLLEKLCKNYRIAIVTNGLTAVQTQRVRNSVLAPYIEDVVISEEVFVSKPNPRIFEIALIHLNHTDKSTVLMVGDSLTSDIQGGMNFGIDTCWYNPRQVENRTSLQPTYEINNLWDLIRFL